MTETFAGCLCRCIYIICRKDLEPKGSVYMLVAMLTIGSIFLVLGVVFTMGSETTAEFMEFIRPFLKLKFK